MYVDWQRAFLTGLVGINSDAVNRVVRPGVNRAKDSCFRSYGAVGLRGLGMQ